MTSANPQLAVSEKGAGPGLQFSPSAITDKLAAELSLIHRVQAGDLNAFYDLVRPYERAVFLAALGLVKNDADAEDVAQEGQTAEDGDYMPRDFADWREIPSEALEQKEVRDALNEALNSLSEKYRTVLLLRDVQQLSIAETAQVLGISEANVKTRLSRARLQLRDALAPGFDGSWICQRACISPKAL